MNDTEQIDIQGGSSTSPEVLDLLLKDSGHPKTELEHHASRVITRLEEELRMHKQMFYESCEERSRLVEMNNNLTQSLRIAETQLIVKRNNAISARSGRKSSY